MRSPKQKSQVSVIFSAKSISITLAGIGLLFIGACTNQAADSTNNSNAGATKTIAKTETASKTATTAKTENNTDHSHSSKGGQVVETGKYHLEFVPIKEETGIHLDFYLQTGDNHAAVPNAKVTADVQSPDGKETTIPLTYKADGKHYGGKLNKGVPGQYQVRINAEVDGEKVNGRFNFNQ